MKISISSKYALNSLRRHTRRTILSVLGIGLGCGLCLFIVGFVKGEGEMMLRAAAESGNGHFRIVPTGWQEIRDNDLRLSQWENTLKMLRENENIKVAVPHTRKEGLLAFGTRTAGVEILGVDASSEQQANRLVKNVTEGKYLSADGPGTTVVGKAVTKQLKVELGDDLMVTVAGSDGQIQNAMLRIVGIVETGSDTMDGTICHVNLSDLEKLTGLEGAGDLTAIVEIPKQLNKIVANIKKQLPSGNELVTWKEISPELASGVEVDKTWTRLTVGIIMIVVFLGIASAQLTAVLERRREFAILSALGMKNLRLIHIMFAEGLVLGLLGGIIGLVIGTPFTYLVAKKGIDFSSFYGESDLAVSKILVDPHFFGDFGWWLIPLAFILSLSATILSSLYPAWYASRTDPAVILRVDN
ncbi:MAG: ABC transporter permease [Sedimentisphaerales bacterium]|nr:ABC transporter permease [Sedimentisphaerales bacterium]